MKPVDTDEKSALSFDRDSSAFYHNLNGSWKFHHALSPFEAPDWGTTDPELWNDIAIPGMWKLHVRLRFEGLDSAYHVWINGTQVGYSQGSHNAAEFDITSLLRNDKGAVDTIAVRWWLSGIFRDVYLVAFPQAGISDITTTTVLNNTFTHADVTATLEGHGEVDQVSLKLLSPDGTLLGEATGRHKMTIPVSGADLRLWSAEELTLYTFLLSHAEQVIPQRIGMRRVELRNGNILLNGQPIMFYGVNRHEHHPLLGRTVPYELMRRDLIIMKHNNINAVRTSHYPNGPRMYEVADELGLYVINEADLERHSFYKPERQRLAATGVQLDQIAFREQVYVECRPWTSDNPEWKKAYLNRAEQLVERFKNSTSTIVWSLGNEAFHGQNLATILVQYEADQEASTADFYSSMYHTIDELKERAVRHTDRPFILCEYAHAMGNGPGGLKDYIDIFRSEKALQGASSGDGTPYYGYGGDFGDTLNDGEFLRLDHAPSPGMVEYRKVIDSVTVEHFDSETGKVTLRSHHFFTDLSHLAGSWSVTVRDQAPTETNALALTKISPNSTGVLQRPRECVEFLELHASQDAWMNLSFRLKPETAWAAARHEIAWSQLYVPLSDPTASHAPTRPSTPAHTVKWPEAHTVPGHLVISAHDSNAQVLLDLVRGGFEWTFASGIAVEKGPELSIYRAMTSSDPRFGGNGADWTLCMLAWARLSDGVIVATEVRIAPPTLTWAIRATLKYIFSPVLDSVSVHVKGDLKRRETASPHPSVMPRIGLYHATVAQLQVPYEVPQENGSRGEVSWVRLAADEDIHGAPIIEARMEHGCPS
ncbi:glycosyl hydrolases family 2, TIM barrel domain-containing protein [Aspergillus insuetus]